MHFRYEFDQGKDTNTGGFPPYSDPVPTPTYPNPHPISERNSDLYADPRVGIGLRSWGQHKGWKKGENKGLNLPHLKPILGPVDTALNPCLNSDILQYPKY